MEKEPYVAYQSALNSFFRVMECETPGVFRVYRSFLNRPWRLAGEHKDFRYRWWRHKDAAEKFLKEYAENRGWKRIEYHIASF